MATHREHDFFALKVLRWLIFLPLLGIGGCSASLFLLVLVLSFDDASTSRADRRSYASIASGMNQSDVEKVFDRTPDYTCQFGSFTLIYYIDPWNVEDGRVDILTYSFPKSVESKDEFPRVNDSKQLLMDANGVVIAHIWSGRELSIQTKEGVFDGTNIGALPEEFFDKLSDPNK